LVEDTGFGCTKREVFNEVQIVCKLLIDANKALHLRRCVPTLFGCTMVLKKACPLGCTMAL
jgi:hypothetical protein